MSERPAREVQMITIEHQLDSLALGIGVVYAENVMVADATDSLRCELQSLVVARRQPLDPADERRRQAARDMLRNGRYKPTGRGKPASEYLLREAQGDAFPLINGPVDANNLVSLRYLLPISVWDPDLAQCDRFAFRLGGEGESYIFNQAGQALDLRDLICGCAQHKDRSQPIVTPIKDGAATKIRGTSSRLVGAIYFPLADPSVSPEAVTADFGRWLMTCGPAVRSAVGVMRPGEAPLEFECSA
jgi:DNA/RNA-binding domain of Phe-tRNA-synthetase-like protein